MFRPINGMRGAIMVWLISYIFFLLTLANNFSASHDSINYLNAIVKGEHLFHPHHLLYHYYAHIWLLLFKIIFPAVADHYIIESFTAIWGSAILAICYLFYRNRFNLTPGMSALSVTLIGFSYGTWFYSVNIEVYTPPIFFILCSLYIITKKEIAAADIWKVAILQSFAILFHQINILFTIVVIYWFLMNRNKIKVASSLLKYAVLGLILTGGLYIICGAVYEQKTTVNAFTGWILGYTRGHSYWQTLSLHTPVSVLAGFSRAFIGAHFIFQHPALEHLLNNSFRSHGLRDEIFLSSALTSVVTWVLTFITALFILCMIIMVFRFIKYYRKMDLHFFVINPLLLTILVYSIFFCFWMPEILEFWILQMVLVWLLLAGMLPAFNFPFNIVPLKVIFIISISLFLVNFFGSIRWLQKSTSDWYYVEVKKLDTRLTADDIIVVENEWILKDYVRYFSKATVIATDELDYNRGVIQKLVKNAVLQNHQVILYREGWQPIRSY
ncbi:MAG TPA: hypothetical protein VM101_13845 [Flavitalea sp.]|nr:hypothetical protein [Flavitalea sp.]